jgi:F-type H+-transporting ATPase subunit a
VFILLCNALSTLFPWSEEPTTDINTALGLGITSFLYIQWFSIQTKGLWPYIKGYFSPMFIMFPLNVVGKLANIVSISFRLFGNIFGGALISKIYHSFIQGSFSLELFGLTSGFNLFVINIYFGLFEGLIQAFVFSMLTMTYLSIALQAGEDGGH